MGNYNFKKFTGVNSRMEDRISITKSSAIGFPMKFYNDNNLASFNYVILFYDAEKKAIAIQFSNDETEKNKFKIVKYGHAYGGGIGAKSFFRGIGIDPALYAGKYEPKKEPLEGIGEVFIITISEAKSIVSPETIPPTPANPTH